MKYLLLIVAIALSIASIDAQTWNSLNSPEGFKTVRDLEVTYRSSNSDTMYAADGLKLLKSVNSGQSWSATSSVIAGATAVTCKYDDQSVVLVSGPSVFSRSTNGGSSWSSLSSHNNKPTTLADFPQNTSVMLLGKKYYSTTERSIAKSTDGGATWDYKLSSSYKTQIFDIAVNVSSAYPAMSVAAGCAIDGTVIDKGLYYTENYGDTWTARMGSTGTGWTAVAFRYHSATETLDTVYAGTAGGGLYRSTWKASSMSLMKTFPDTVRSITIHPDSTWIIFVTTDRSVFKSTDKGSTWNNYISGMSDTRAFALKYKPGSSSTMIVGSRGYVYRSTNYGSNWSEISSTTTRVLPMVSVTTGGSKIYPGTGELTIAPSFNGSTWNTVRIGHKDTTFLTHHSLNIYNGSNKRVVFYVGVADNKSSGYRSLDSGSTFSKNPSFDTDTLNTVVEGIVQDPSYPARVYAFGSLKDGTNTRNYFKSYDYGAGWTKGTSTATTGNTWLAMRPLGDGGGAPSRFVYGGVITGNLSGGLYRSIDTSNSFEKVSTASIGDISIYSVTNNPQNLAYAYAGGSDGLYYSTNANTASNGTVAFTNIWSTSGVKKVVVDPRFLNSAFNSSYIFWAGVNNHIYRSTNNGTTASDMTGDLPGGIVINDLRLDPYDTTKLYIATDQGIYNAQLAAAPDLISPADQSLNHLWCLSSTEPMNLSWSTATGATKYFIQVDNQSNFSSSPKVVDDSTTQTQYSISNDLAEGVNYYWRVRTTNTFGYSPWSKTYWFRTLPGNADTLLPTPTTLSSPSDGATGVSPSPTLSWSSVTSAVKYKIVVIGFTTVYSTTTSKQISGLAHNTTYNWYVTAVNCFASNPASDTFSFTTQNPDGPEDPQTIHTDPTDGDIVTEYHLAQNFPNPFNPLTRFEYALRDEGYVTLRIFNTLGQEVARLVDEHQSAGKKAVEFNAQSLPSGVYFYHLVAGTFNSIKKMIFMK